MGTYTGIKSNFVREKLKKADWKKDSGYINDLVRLEKSVNEKTYGWVANIVIGNLKSKYKKEYNEIFKELNPEEFKKYIKQNKKEEEKDKREEERFDREEKGREKRDKEDWIKAKKRLKGKK